MPIDMSAAKAPPRRSSQTGTTPRARTTAASTDNAMSRQQARRSGVEGGLQFLQAGFLMVNLYADAAVIGNHGSDLAREAALAAEHNAYVATAVDFLSKVGPMSGLVMVLVKMGTQFAANHGLINAKNSVGSGIIPPEVLSAQMQAQVLQMEAEALRQQQKALQDAQQARQEYEAMLSSVTASQNGASAQ